MVREEWLIRAVELLNSMLFNGDLDITHHKFQIACGRCQGKKLTECIQPSDNEDIGLDDFFPTTIHVNFTIKDPKEILLNLAYECIHAFFNIKGCNKKFKTLANKYYFEAPYTSANASDTLKGIIDDVYNKLVKDIGDFPGKPIKFPTKNPKDKKKTSFEIICHECGYTVKTTKKILEKYNGKLPICACGLKMYLAEDYEEETEN